MFFLFINFKNYLEAIGKKGLEIARIAEKVKNQYEDKVDIVLIPNFLDLRLIKEDTKLRVFAQHLDAIKPGAYTGYILAEALKDAKIDGVMLNHSERRILLEDLDKAIERARENNLEVLVCVSNDKLARAVAELEPDYIAVEPPELIGGNVSISKAKPELVERFVKSVKDINDNIKLLVGAGIKTKEDVKKAKELGVDGILVASGVVKAKDKEKAIMDLVSGFIS